MLTARRPFSNDDDPRALLDRIVHEAPPPMTRPEVPHGLVQIILERMLAKDPEERFQTMVDVQAALEQFYSRDNTPVPRRLDDRRAQLDDDPAPGADAAHAVAGAAGARADDDAVGAVEAADRAVRARGGWPLARRGRARVRRLRKGRRW